MGCYCGSKLLHIKCIYTWLDVAHLCPLFIGYIGYFQFSETCFQFSPKSQNLCSCGSSLLDLKLGHLSAKQLGIFRQNRLKKEELPEVEQGTLPSVLVGGSARPGGVCQGQHMRLCLPGEEGELWRRPEGLHGRASQSAERWLLARPCVPGAPGPAQGSSTDTPLPLGSLGLPWLGKNPIFSMCFVTKGFVLRRFGSERRTGLFAGCRQTEDEAKRRSGGSCRDTGADTRHPPSGLWCVWSVPREGPARPFKPPASSHCKYTTLLQLKKRKRRFSLAQRALLLLSSYIK